MRGRMILIKIHARFLTELAAALLLRNEPAWRRYHPTDISKGSTGVFFPCPSLLFSFFFFFHVAECNDGVAFRDQRGALSVLEGRHREYPFSRALSRRC